MISKCSDGTTQMAPIRPRRSHNSHTKGHDLRRYSHEHNILRATWAELSDGLYLAKGRCPSTIARHLDQCLGEPTQILMPGAAGSVLATSAALNGPGLTMIRVGPYAAVEPAGLRFVVGTFASRPPIFNRFCRLRAPVHG